MHLFGAPGSGLRRTWYVALVLGALVGLGALVWEFAGRTLVSRAEEVGYHTRPDHTTAPFTRVRVLADNWALGPGAPVALYYDGSYTGAVQWQFSADGFTSTARVLAKEVQGRTWVWNIPTDLPDSPVCQVRVVAVPLREGTQWQADSPPFALRPQATLDPQRGPGMYADQRLPVGRTVAWQLHTNVPDWWDTVNFELDVHEVESTDAFAVTAIVVHYDQSTQRLYWTVPDWAGQHVYLRLRVPQYDYEWRPPYAVAVVASGTEPTVLRLQSAGDVIQDPVWYDTETGLTPVAVYPGQTVQLRATCPTAGANDTVEVLLQRTDTNEVLSTLVVTPPQLSVTFPLPDLDTSVTVGVPVRLWITLNRNGAAPEADTCPALGLPQVPLTHAWTLVGPPANGSKAVDVPNEDIGVDGRHVHVVSVPVALYGVSFNGDLPWEYGVRVKRHELDAWSPFLAFTPAAAQLVPALGGAAHLRHLLLELNEYLIPVDEASSLTAGAWSVGASSLWVQVGLRNVPNNDTEVPTEWSWSPYTYRLLSAFAPYGQQPSNTVGAPAVVLLVQGLEIDWPSEVPAYTPVAVTYRFSDRVSAAVQWEWTYFDRRDTSNVARVWQPLSPTTHATVWTWQPRAPVTDLDLAYVQYQLRVVAADSGTLLATSPVFALQWDAPDEDTNAAVELLQRWALQPGHVARTAQVELPRAEVASVGAVCTLFTGPVGQPGLDDASLTVWCRPYVGDQGDSHADVSLADGRTWRPLPATAKVVRSGLRRLDWTVPPDWTVGQTYEVTAGSRRRPLARSYARSRVTVRGSVSGGRWGVLRTYLSERGADPVGSGFWLTTLADSYAAPPRLRSRWTFDEAGPSPWFTWPAPARSELRLGGHWTYGWSVPAPFADTAALLDKAPAPGDVWTWEVQANDNDGDSWYDVTETPTDGVTYRMYVRKSPQSWQRQDGTLVSLSSLEVDLWGWTAHEVQFAYQWEHASEPVDVLGPVWAATAADARGPVQLPLFHALDGVPAVAAAAGYATVRVRLVLRAPDGWETATAYAPVLNMVV